VVSPTNLEVPVTTPGGNELSGGSSSGRVSRGEGKREIKPKTHFGDHDKTQLSKNTKISTSVDVLDQAPEPIKDKDGNLLFQVEKIIDEQEQKDGTFMYVKWSGYDDTHNRSIHDTDK
jgi:hypothetical protein